MQFANPIQSEPGSVYPKWLHPNGPGGAGSIVVMDEADERAQRAALGMAPMDADDVAATADISPEALAELRAAADPDAHADEKLPAVDSDEDEASAAAVRAALKAQGKSKPGR